MSDSRTILGQILAEDPVWPRPDPSLLISKKLTVDARNVRGAFCCWAIGRPSIDDLTWYRGTIKINNQSFPVETNSRNRGGSGMLHDEALDFVMQILSGWGIGAWGDDATRMADLDNALATINGMDPGDLADFEFSGGQVRLVHHDHSTDGIQDFEGEGYLDRFNPPPGWR
jgi:hypothetical protein